MSQFPSLIDSIVINDPTTVSPKPKKRETAVPEEDGHAKVKVGKMVAKRIWNCTNTKTTCKGQSPFLGWHQLLDKPSCPNCGHAMRWHQWGVVVTEEKK